MKKAGEISAAADKYNASGISNQQPTMDIPDIQVPDYPDRLTPRRGPFKSQGPISQSNKQGLTAPNITDVSSSGPNTNYKTSFSFRFPFNLLHHQTKRKKLVHGK